MILGCRNLGRNPAGEKRWLACAGTPFVTQEIFATAQVALSGDKQARACMMVFRQAAATALGKNLGELPTLEDIVEAGHGHSAAIARLSEFSQKGKVTQHVGASQGASQSSTSSFAGFHTSLKGRLKRLDRMGANVELEASDGKTWIVVAVLSLLLGPFALAAVGLLLVLIGIMMMTSLAFLVIWMAFIHQIFFIFLHH